MYEIKQEQQEDWWDVESLFDLSFAPGREALSSYRLRDGVSCVEQLCLVARDSDGVLGGAIRFWPIKIGDNEDSALLLGPIAVHPTRQGEGLGWELMRMSLDKALSLGWNRIILVGDAPYYTRFGFKKADFLQYPPPTNPDRLLYLGLGGNAFSQVTGLIKSAKNVAISP